MTGGLLIAGFDAGQTHTRCRLARLKSQDDFTVVAEGEGPGVSHLDASAGETRFSSALAGSLAAALSSWGEGSADNTSGDERNAPSLVAAAIGASGIEAGSSVQARGQRLAAQTLGLSAEHVLVTGDEHTALEGARGDAAAGILLISGTGCIALGRNEAGAMHRCGGWGWLLDGAGSACDIGRDGLAVSLQMADGRLPDSPLRQALWQTLELAADDPAAAQAIKARVVDAAFGPAGLARLAPVVHQLALAGEPEAQAIVLRSAEALATMAASIARRLQLSAPPVWPAGGALNHLSLLRQGVNAALNRQCPGAHLAPPAGDACDGALQLASALLRQR